MQTQVDIRNYWHKGWTEQEEIRKKTKTVWMPDANTYRVSGKIEYDDTMWI